LDELLQHLQAQDRRRSQLLSAMESKAPSACSNVLCIDNYFETQIKRPHAAHFLTTAARHNPRR
jgi:hypothetical protein